jgi:hypothetical protein
MAALAAKDIVALRGESKGQDRGEPVLQELREGKGGRGALIRGRGQGSPGRRG